MLLKVYLAKIILNLHRRAGHMAKKIWLGFAGAILIAVVGAYFYIANIDWNQHKDKIAAQFSEITGKRVVFEGPVSFKIFPSPYLTASGIKVYNMQGANSAEPLATIKNLVAKLSLMPLLNGNFEVKMMSLQEPEIFFEVLPDGTVNWQSPLTDAQKSSLENIDVSLDSVMLENATVNVIDEKHGVTKQLNKLNAEVIASSVFGPYRIEGSYLQNKNPEGFAISLGQFSESFATSLNMVLNQPASQTYLRFDGSFLLQNSAVNGSLIFESKDLTGFVNDSLWDLKLDENYDYPLAVSLELNTNKTRIDLSNIVVKYGQTAGAGNVLIPLMENEFRSDVEEGNERRRIEMAIDMTDFDLNPFMHTLKQLADKYSNPEAEYNPQYNFDILADVKAIKAYYKDQTIRDFNLSMDFVNNDLEIKNFTATLPGDSTVSLKGDAFSVNDELTYALETNLTTNDFQKFSSWLGLKIDPVAQATYKRAIATALVSGNLKNIKISPFDVTLDKMALKGSMGIVRDVRPAVYLSLSADSINFDNYIAPLPEEEAKKDFAARMAYRFGKLKWLNDTDVNLNLKLDLGIYENIPFENMVLETSAKDGIMDIKALQIGSLANSSLMIEGKLKGFGSRPAFDNIKYTLESPDITALANKFEVELPVFDTKDLRKLSSKGIFSGYPDRIAIKATSKLGYLDNVYSGELAWKDKKMYFNGQLELKAPDFVKFANDMGFNYTPKAFSLGVFNFSGQIQGSADKFKVLGVNAFAGSNNFKGSLLADRTGTRPSITANMQVNNFECERFFYNSAVISAGASANFRPVSGSEEADFLARPYWDKTKLDYSFYNKFNFKGKLAFGSLSYQNYILKNAIAEVALNNGVLAVSRLSGTYREQPVSADFELAMAANPLLKGKFGFKNQIIDSGYLSGRRYGIVSGTADADVSFNGPAASIDDIFTHLNADITYIIRNPLVKGWDLRTIRDDLSTRDRSEGLAVLVLDALQRGETQFDVFSGSVKVTNGNYEFKEAGFAGDNTVIKMQDSGNLDLWDMNAGFEVRLSELENLPPFSFQMSGPMLNPSLTVDVKAITDGYDAKWAKVAADKKAAEDARAAFLKGLMDKAQQGAHEVKNSFDKEVIPEYESLSALAGDENIVRQYEAIKAEMDKVNSGLGEIFTLGLTKDFDEKLPESLEKKTAVYAKSIEKIKGDIAANYANDIKLRINSSYNKIVDVYNKSKEKSIGYHDKFGVFPKRIAAIKTEYTIDEDEHIKNLKESIEKKLLAIDAINSQVVKDYIFIQNTADRAKLEDYATQIKELHAKAEDETAALDKDITALLTYAEEKVALEEKIYQDRLKAEEIKRKLEENVGAIVGAKGKTKTVVRDLEDIEKSEEALEKEDVKVLDFSDKSESAGVIRNDDTGVEKKTDVQNESELPDTGIIRRATGSISKASGTIVKK